MLLVARPVRRIAENRGQTAEAIRDHFDRLAGQYSQTADWVADARLLEAIARRVACGPVLDVAAGPGVASARVPTHKGPLFGVDFSFDMCIQARSAGFSAVHGRAEALPVRTAAVSTIICRQGLHYLDLPAALAEWSRVLRKGGHAVVAQIGSTSEQQTAWWTEVKRTLQPLRRRWFSSDALQTILCDHGWGIDGLEIVCVDNVRTLDHLFAEAAVSRDEARRLAEKWEAAAPPEISFRMAGDRISFSQRWLVWTMAPQSS